MLHESNHPSPGSRINVVGTTGSGKTVTAKLLAERLGLRFIEIDALSWRPNWEMTPRDELPQLVDEATQGDRWVIDGNYSAVRMVLWPKLDTIIWLDYRFLRVFWQLLRRTVRRSITGEVLWNGCRERFRASFFSKDSILLWCFRTYWRRRRNYPRIFQRPEHAHIDVLRFRTPRAFRRWFRSLPQ
ncbi:AAA family ATPase [Candidatus Bipolaricaulota bacterium]